MQKMSTSEDVIRKIAGESGLPLYKALKNKKNVSEFKLAEDLKIEINIIRNLLYKLYHANLVSFTRKKDKQKGWYIYYWTLKNDRLKYLITALKKEMLEIMKERLEREKENFFFMCKNECLRLNFDQAMDMNYKCPECGELMQQIDNDKKVAVLEKEIGIIEKEILKKRKKKKVTKKEKKKPIKKDKKPKTKTVKQKLKRIIKKVKTKKSKTTKKKATKGKVKKDKTKKKSSKKKSRK